MADPSMQTFCCHRVPDISESADFLLDFNKNPYNILCLTSSSIGILGAIYQIWPRHPVRANHRWSAETTSRGRHIVVWLAVADLLASCGVFLRSIMWLYYDKWGFLVSPQVVTISCAIAAAWIQYFYTVTWLWTMVYAIDMRLVLKGRRGYPMRYHMTVWAIPAVFTATGLTILYVPDANCHSIHTKSAALLRILPNFFANYLPMAVVMVVNPLLYSSLTRDVELAVSSAAGQMTGKERAFVDLFRLKFCLINVVFYVCWLPNLINGILVWTLWLNLPQDVLIGLWYVMALTNPMQALFNSFVYRKWSGGDVMYNPFRKKASSMGNGGSSSRSKRSSSLPTNESTPLIGSSINGSTNSDEENDPSIYEL